MSLSPLSTSLYQSFAEFLQSQCGIVLGENKQYLVKSRLTPLAHEFGETGLPGLIEQALVPGQHRLKERIIEAMATHETYWFRDGYPFLLLKDELLPNKVNQGRLRIWSAACSTGQEPYSLGIILEEFRQKNPGQMLNTPQIVATDISRPVLASAEKGVFDTLALGRGLSEERKRRFFTPVGGAFAINDQIKKMITFRQLNLLGSYQQLGQFDFIFCRNVLIYFSQSDKEKILRQFAAALPPGGCLVLGASESISSLTDLYEMKRYPSGILYFRR